MERATVTSPISPVPTNYMDINLATLERNSENEDPVQTSGNPTDCAQFCDNDSAIGNVDDIDCPLAWEINWTDDEDINTGSFRFMR